ncbi:MAG: glycosyltransferase family 87 protein [Terriglobales bacterium]
MQPKARQLHYLAQTLLFAVPAISIGAQLSTWVSFAFGSGKDHPDFLAYYDAGFLLRSGRISDFYHQIHPPWFGFIHPTYEALLFVPLSFLSPVKAYVAWIVVGVTIIGVILRILWREFDHLTSISPILPVALTLAFFPISYALAQGQDSILLLLLMVLSLIQVKSGNQYCAGLLLGLGIFRFQILLPMAAMFLIWKSWRFLAGICTSAACALCCSLALTGISGQIEYVKLLRLLANPANQFVQQMPNIRGVLAAFGVVSQPTILIVSAVCFILLALLGRNPPPSERFFLAMAAACLLSFHGYLHDFALLLLPFLILCDRFVERADYMGLALLGMIIALPIITIMIGSIMAVWICSLVPILLIFLITVQGSALPMRTQHAG